MNAFGQQMKRHFHLTNSLERLILANVTVFLLIRLINAISSLFLYPILDFEFTTYYLAVPANVSELLVRPWTIFTYMFLHWDPMHILFNMLWLYWMGKILAEFLGSKKILSTYILGGLAGAVFYIIAFNLFPLFTQYASDSFALGASASVLAVTVAAATLVPDYQIQLLFFGPVKLKYIAIFSILLDLISISSTNAGGHIAHLGGAFFGFIYIKQLRNGRDLAGWLNRIFYREPKKGKMKVEVGVSSRKYRKDEDFIVQKKASEEKMDEILDKISRSGWGSLTKEERAFMHQISNKKDDQ